MSDDRPPSPWRWWICAVLLLATTLNYMDRIALNLLSKEIIDAFDITKVWYGILESGFQIAFGLGAITFGILVDRFGVRRVYPVAVVGWSCAGFLTGFADGYWSLFACRMMLGIFEAGNWPCGIRTTRQVLPAKERSLGNSIFQSGTGLGAIVTPPVIALALMGTSPGDENTWQIPFRWIGACGMLWVAVWMLTIPKGQLIAREAPRTEGNREPFSAVFRDRRFWILIAVIIGVNTTWHTFRVWLPLFLRGEQHYSRDAMLEFNTLYFIVADLGSWAAGLAVVLLVKFGWALHRARLATFGVGIAFILPAGAIPFVKPDYLPALILVTAFGALGIFATYFALSQEISGKNQGKITGLLGLINSLYLAGLYWAQGSIGESVGSLGQVLAVAPIPALFAFGVVWRFWPQEASSSTIV